MVDLKPIDRSDLPFWRDLTSRPESTEHQPLPQRSLSELRTELDLYTDSDLSNPSHENFKWVVLDNKTGERLGVVSFDRLDFRHKIGRIGYTLSRRVWGQGYATQAVKALVDKVFRESDVERIEAECSLDNPASARVLEKNGFGLEGIKRGYLIIRGERVDHFSYGLLRSTWQEGL